MTVSSFQDLYDGFCDAAGTARQQLEDDTEGVVAFSATVRDVTVNVMHTPETHPDCCFVLVDFGPPPQESQAEALRVLLTANFSMLGEENATAFSIHPVFGNVTLQATYPFAGRSGDHLMRAIGVLVEMALTWRETRFLQTVPATGDRA